MIGGKNKQTKFGFTLTELIVAVAIFALVITGAITLLTTVLRTQRKSAVIQSVQDNARYLMGFMAKEIRMSEFRGFDGTTQVLEITHPINGDISYTFTGTPNWQIIREDDSTLDKINSDEVEVDGGFYIDGKAVGGDNEQPRVTMVIKVRITGTKTEEQAEINLQTTLSQRNFD
jgi:prepilin-type N-terminal cleavage/methylation domain-containing protein